MELELIAIPATQVRGKRYSVARDGGEIARAYLYILGNDLHRRPFGLLEDVFVEEDFRGIGLGYELVNQVIQAARDAGCYKLICTSRHEKQRVHALYEKLGFENHGLEFRMEFGEAQATLPFEDK